MIQLEAYSPQYFQDILQLFYDTVHTVNAGDYTQAQLDAWAPREPDRQRWAKNLSQSTGVVALEDARVVGIATLAGTAEFDLLYIHPQYQRRGIAGMLAQRIEEEARRRGSSFLFTEASITAKGFFEHRGYRIAAAQRKPLRGAVFLNYVMVRQWGGSAQALEQVLRQRHCYYRFFQLDTQSAGKILSWKYPAPYDVYNMKDASGGLEELLCGEYYGVASPDGSLLGFFCYGNSARVPALQPYGAYEEDALDIGLGIAPEFCGMGMGLEFLKQGMAFAAKEFPRRAQRLRLTAAAFNERAKAVYRRAGFETVGVCSAGEGLPDYEVMTRGRWEDALWLL